MRIKESIVDAAYDKRVARALWQVSQEVGDSAYCSLMRPLKSLYS